MGYIINPTHLTDYLQRNARQNGGKPAIVFEGGQITWAELWQRVEKASHFFEDKLGIGEQKVAAMLMTNSIEFVEVYLSIVHAGHIAMPLDPVYKKLELDAILESLPPSMLIIQPRYQEQVGTHEAFNTYQASDLLGSEGKEGSRLKLSPKEQIASLLFTSGSSGQPKAVPNTHTNHIWNIEVCSKVWDWTEQDSLLITLPLSHMHGLIIGLSGALYHGNTLYLRQQSFDAEGVLQDLSSGKISMFTHGPIAYMRMLDTAGDYDLSKLRAMISGSAPLPPALWRAFKGRFGVEIIETYGTTETGRIAANGLARNELGSPGKILPGVELQLSKHGEILVKSDGLFPGYWHNPQATAASRTNDSFWRTGDIGELKNGYLYLKGRTQERIRRFGYTISPRDIEWALLENPDIREVFVLGRQIKGEQNDELTFFVAGDITRDEIGNYSKANLPFNWRPDHIVLIDQLPRTKNGKPKISQLKALAT